MILYQDALLELKYDVSLDVLYVNWPSLTERDIPELKHGMVELVDAIKHYDIKKFLIDSGKSQVDIPDEVYKPLVFSFIGQLKDTRLHRMARVIPESSLREARPRSYDEQMRAESLYNFETAEFDSQESALAWLKG